MSILKWLPTRSDDKAIARDFALSLDFKNMLIRNGFKIDPRTIKGKHVDYAIKVVDGKKYEYPILSAEIDLYVTGVYRNDKNQEKQLTIRIPVNYNYINQKTFLDFIKTEMETKSKAQFKEWSQRDVASIRKYDRIDVNFPK